MRIYRTREFSQFCKKNRIPVNDLCETVARMRLGAINADLGGGVYKQRLRRKGQGKSGGFRTIVFLRVESLAIFVYGFAKNDRDNIERYELEQFRQFAKEVFSYGDQEFQKLLKAGALEEICTED